MMSNTWLDTETRAILSGLPPSKLAPADTRTFSLVVLSIPDETDGRLSRALRRIDVAENVGLSDESPRVVRREMSYADAMLGQFEFICCDVVSVFIADEVLASASESYLRDLYSRLRESREFVLVEALLCPPFLIDSSWAKFCDQFIGLMPRDNVFRLQMPLKKARIMKHWASKRGGTLDINGQ